ncbi:MAG: type II secretion system F family protein [Verrucomicrobiota bacterium]|nr:type II secretion system F family protein [Verrucomicrobiota bacterium]
MPEFNYLGVNSKGKTLSGNVVADSLKEARQNLRSNGLTPLKLELSDSDSLVQSTRIAGKKVNRKEVESSRIKGFVKGGSKGEKVGLEFLKRLVELHGSGMPVADAVKLLNQRLSDPVQKEIAGFLWRELAEGRTLSRAMRQLPQFFSESSTFVIEAGEATGNVSPILRKIISYLEEKREIRSKVLSSMSYPIFVCLMAFGVVLFFLFFLLEKIESMLDSLGGELNLMSKILINGSEMLLTIGPFILVAAILFLGGVFQWSKTEKGGVSLDRSLLRLPLFGKIFFMSELFQLSNLLSALIWSGIGLTENLRLCERTIKNRYMRSQFRAARALVNEGKSLPDALRRFKFMPLMQLDIIEVGEKTGNLGNSVEDACKAFREDLTKRIKAMTTLVSGAALGFAFSLVALVAISIVTSIFQVSKTMTF